MLLKLTLGFGVIVVEVLFPLCGGKLTHVFDKHVFTVVIAEPVHTEGTFLEVVITRACNFIQSAMQTQATADSVLCCGILIQLSAFT